MTPKTPDLGEELDLPRWADIAAFLNGGELAGPKPEILTRKDGAAIFYAGQVNTIFGDSEAGKSWIALAAVAEHLNDGGSAALIDLDHNGIGGFIPRLLRLGVPADVVTDPDRLRYLEPEDAHEYLAAVRDCRTWAPGIVLVDSLGELLPLFGASSNSPDEFTAVHSRALKPLAMVGSCVLVIDHTPKNAETAAAGATGTNAKKRATGGTSLRVTVNTAYAKGRGGSSRLDVHKDRHSGLKTYCPPGREPHAGTFHLTDTPTGDLTWTITPPATQLPPDAHTKPATTLEDALRAHPEAATVAELTRAVLGREGSRAEKAKTWRRLQELIKDGTVAEAPRRSPETGGTPARTFTLAQHQLDTP